MYRYAFTKCRDHCFLKFVPTCGAQGLEAMAYRRLLSSVPYNSIPDRHKKTGSRETIRNQLKNPSQICTAGLDVSNAPSTSSMTTSHEPASKWPPKVCLSTATLGHQVDVPNAVAPCLEMLKFGAHRLWLWSTTHSKPSKLPCSCQCFRRNASASTGPAYVITGATNPKP